MREIAEPAEVRRLVREARCSAGSVGLVPTMGYLHAGHARLFDVAGSENTLVVCSIFVNPTQFGPNEDFDRYPRDLRRDRELAEDHGVDILFVPTAEAMYPDGVGKQTVWVDPGILETHLDGASRPGHFRGVTTVVTKLFNLIDPDRAYFGQKDAQQVIILSRMVVDLAFPIEMRVVPTVRELDGLALSSRNVYLTSEERVQAPALYRALDVARTLIARGERLARLVREAISAVIHSAAPLARIDFVEIADLRTLEPVAGRIEGDVLIALAVYFGSTRLIDNVMVRFDGDKPTFS